MKKAAALILVLILALGLCAPAAAAGTALDRAMELVEQSIREWKSEVDLKDAGVYADEVLEAMRRFSKEPELFYYENCSVWSESGSGKVTKVELYYAEGFDRKDVEALEAAAEEALACVLPGMDDLQKLLVLHDYLTLNVAYDYDNYRAGTVPPASYTAYGALVLGTAVCEGYTMAYQLLLKRCGISSAYVSSGSMNHGWCQVRLGDEWYHVDVTWDDPAPDRIGRAGHAYFLLSDAAVSDKEHRHYGWSADYECTDTRFDSNVFWAGLEQPIIYTDRDTLWLMKESGDYTDQTIRLVRRSWRTGEETAMVTLRDYWPTWEGGAYWLDAYTGLCLWDERLFFNDSLHIYSYDPADGSWETEFTYDGHDGYLYGLSAAADGLLVMVQQSPNEAGTVYGYSPERKHAVNPFRDVDRSDYFYDAVLWALENQVTKGTGDDTFSPADTCTRGQVATFLWRAMGCPEPRTEENPFADVPEGQYYRDAVLWAVEQGVTNGTGTDAATGKQRFSPDALCSYAHILTFLWRTLTGKSSSSYGEWYSEPLDWAEEQGLLRGTGLGNGTAGVLDDCPRCDVVTYLWRYAA